jgi:hypothetical protein
MFGPRLYKNKRRVFHKRFIVSVTQKQEAARGEVEEEQKATPTIITNRKRRRRRSAMETLWCGGPSG